MDFKDYRRHLASSTGMIDRAKEWEVLREVGNEEWAIKLRALLLGHYKAGLFPMRPICAGYLLQKADQAHAGTLVLDEFCQAEYDRLKRNFEAVKMMVVEDVT